MRPAPYAARSRLVRNRREGLGLRSRPTRPGSPRRRTCSPSVGAVAGPGAGVEDAHDRHGLGDTADEDRTERLEADTRVLADLFGGHLRAQHLPRPREIDDAGREVDVAADDVVAAPAGTPDDILNSLNTHVVKIVQAADVKQRLSEDGLVPVGNSREQFAAYIKSKLVKWAQVIRQSGARID